MMSEKHGASLARNGLELDHPQPTAEEVVSSFSCFAIHGKLPQSAKDILLWTTKDSP